MFTHRSTPNQIRSIPSLAATGASSGTMMNAISKKSRKNARKNTNTFTKIRNPTLPPGRPERRCSIHRSPSTPRNVSVKMVEPIRMKITMAVMRIVEREASAIRPRSAGITTASSMTRARPA